MEPKNQKDTMSKNIIIGDFLLGGFLDSDLDTVIRMGVAIEDEAAKKETTRRKIEAPLSIEETLFFSKA